MSVPILWIGLDDLDGENSEDTGAIANEIANQLSLKGYEVETFKLSLPKLREIDFDNENAAYALKVCMDPGQAIDFVGELVMDLSSEDSDPGLALVMDRAFPLAVKLAKASLNSKIPKDLVLKVSEQTRVQVLELGGNGDGIIGAFCAAVLASVGSAEKYPRFNPKKHGPI